MSKIIKSASVILDGSHYSVSADVTNPDAINTAMVNEEQALIDERLKQAEMEAQSILQTARSEAADIVDKAEQDARLITENAIEKAKILYDNKREEAQNEGFAQGFDAGQSEAQVLIDEALMIKEEWTINRDRFIRRMEEDIIDLCLKAVQNVINREIDDPSYILDLIKKGIDNLTYTSSLVVRVSEYDYDYAAANKSKILAMIDGVENIEVRKDLSLDHTECVIDTDTGSIDIGISSQIEQVQKLFNTILSGD